MTYEKWLRVFSGRSVDNLKGIITYNAQRGRKTTNNYTRALLDALVTSVVAEHAKSDESVRKVPRRDKSGSKYVEIYNHVVDLVPNGSALFLSRPVNVRLLDTDDNMVLPAGTKYRGRELIEDEHSLGGVPIIVYNANDTCLFGATILWTETFFGSWGERR